MLSLCVLFLNEFLNGSNCCRQRSYTFWKVLECIKNSAGFFLSWKTKIILEILWILNRKSRNCSVVFILFSFACQPSEFWTLHSSDSDMEVMQFVCHFAAPLSYWYSGIVGLYVQNNFLKILHNKITLWSMLELFC